MSDFPVIPEGVRRGLDLDIVFVKTQDAAEPNGTETFTKAELKKNKDKIPKQFMKKFVALSPATLDTRWSEIRR